MEETSICIAGKDTLLMNTGTAYRIVSGRVLVFIVPLHPETGIPQQRRLLYEATVGAVIPALLETADRADGIRCAWTFLLVPLEPAELLPCADSTQVREAFCDFLPSPLPEGESFAERVIRFYNLETLQETESLHAAQKESSDAAQRSLREIRAMFYRDKFVRRNKHTQHTDSALYDAAARLCDWQRISIAPLGVIQSGCGKNFAAKDIARISKFACRNVVLTPDWFKRDSGPVLAWYGEEGCPVACIPVKPGRYRVWNPKTEQEVPLTKAVAQQLAPNAMVFYRPFPEEKIGLKSLVRFAAQEIYIRDIVYILLFTLLGIVIGLVQSYLNQQLYDLFIPLGDVSSANMICLVALSCAIGGLGFTVAKGLANFRAITRMKYAVQAAVVDRLFNLPESFFRQYDSADLVGRAMSISSMIEMLAQVAVSVWLSAVFSLAYLGRMLKYSKQMSLSCLLLLAVLMAIIALLGWWQLRFQRTKLELDGRLSSLLNQLILGVTKIRMAGAEDRALNRYMEMHTQRTRLMRNREGYTRAASLISGLSSTMFSMIMYYQMIHNDLGISMGAFMGFSSAFGAFSSAMLSLVSSFLNVNETLPAFARMQPILETLPENRQGAALPGALKGNISIDHVSFRYDPESAPFLRDISMEIHAGEYIGIVGPSGCGKSTLLKLLLGLETPQEGKIFYDNQDMDGMDKQELRKQFGVVLQDGGVIPGSISDNISITCPTATREEIQEAVQMAGLADDIAKMPMGLNTMLSEGSGTVSGGQKQRILIARAIVGKPHILFFDEATSALDNNTQRIVCDSLERMNSTRIVIAHRLSTIMHCDRIYVLQNGEIEECGTYEELMAQHGFFWQLASRQLEE